MAKKESKKKIIKQKCQACKGTGNQMSFTMNDGVIFVQHRGGYPLQTDNPCITCKGKGEIEIELKDEL